MAQFMGSHQNRLDAKGRVSVPASFRTALRASAEAAGLEGSPLVLRPSHTYKCIEGWPAAAFQALAAPLDDFEQFSEEHDDLAASLYADASPIEADKEGRIVLPESLVAHADLTEMAVFMGVGKMFLIWEPAAAARRVEEARERTRVRKLTLSARTRAANGTAAT